MKIGDIGKVGTNLSFRVARIEYMNGDSLVVRYKDDSMEKVGVEDFIPLDGMREVVAVITDKEFDEAFREALKHPDFAERLKGQLFGKYYDAMN